MRGGEDGIDSLFWANIGKANPKEDRTIVLIDNADAAEER